MSAAAAASLLSLPADILLSLPFYLRDIEDFINLAATCRLLHELSLHTTPRTILHLAAAVSRIFFRPDPHFLVAATARQVGEWASLSSENTAALRTAFRKGMEGLLELALEHAGLRMERIRELYEMRFSTINPVVDIIDKCIGEQWYSTPDFWYGGVDDAATIRADPPETFFHLAIYGELFGPAFDVFQSTTWDPRRGDCGMDPRRAVQPAGPYAPFLNTNSTYPDGFKENDGQLGLRHLLHSTRWNPSWADVRAAVGGDFEEVWKQDLWWAIVMCQGMAGMEMVKPGNLAQWRERLVAWRATIAGMTTKPDKVTIEREEAYVFPDPKGDLDIAQSRV